MGGRSGERRRAASVRTLSRRLEAAVGKEHAKTLLEIAEALTISEAQLERVNTSRCATSYWSSEERWRRRHAASAPRLGARGESHAALDVTSRRRLRPLPQRDLAQRQAVDWWVRIVPAVLAVHLIVVLTLRARPGHLGLWLWYAGPIALAAATALLLVGSLRSAYRWKHGVNRWQVLAYLALVVVIFTLPVYEAYPSSYDERPSAVEFRLPLEGPVTVAWGGASGTVNYHVFLPDQRWAYDLLVTHDGRTFGQDGVAVEDYYAYGLPVVAPAAGIVFASRDGEPDVAIDEPRWGLAGLGTTSASKWPLGSICSWDTCSLALLPWASGIEWSRANSSVVSATPGTAASPTSTYISRTRPVRILVKAFRSTFTSTGRPTASSSAACRKAAEHGGGIVATAS